MREGALDGWVHAQYRAGATILGVCGGFQMMGEAIADPDGVESCAPEHAGLGLAGREDFEAVEKTRDSRATMGDDCRSRRTRSILGGPRAC